MPKLWNETVEAHRRDVRASILDTTWRLAVERGVLSVTMSRIAEAVGIGRATLYKYFPNVEAILVAHHQQHVAAHLDHLTQLVDQAGPPDNRLDAVLTGYALISYHRGQHGTDDLGALVHRRETLTHAEQQVTDLMRRLLTEAAATGDVRDDTAPDELARYCLHALSAAGSLPSEAAAHRLVMITRAGLRPQE